MDTEQLATDPETEVAAAEPEAEQELDAGQEAEAEQPDAEADEAEIDWNGRKVRVPRDMESAFMKNADYTQKTQTHAEQVKAHEADRAAFKAQRAEQEKFISQYATLEVVNTRMNQLNQIDRRTLTGDQQVALIGELQQLQVVQANVSRDLEQKKQDQTLQEQRESAKHLEDSAAELRKSIPGFDKPETKARIAKAASSLGYTADEIASISDPRAVKALHLASLGQQWQEKQRASTQATQAVVAEPVPRVNGNRARSTTPNIYDPKISVKEYNRIRDAQEAKRRGA